MIMIMIRMQERTVSAVTHKKALNKALVDLSEGMDVETVAESESIHHNIPGCSWSKES